MPNPISGTAAAATVPLRFFQAVQQRDCVQIWNLLSQRSQRMIVELLAQGWKAHSREQLRAQFASGDAVARTYWASFAEAQQLDKWLQQSYRQLGNGSREVVVKASPSGVSLLVYQEAGQWKFGYIESFVDFA
ncbi:MAG: hypothetical protein ACO1RX_11515 [Candidatus Sericytochromatia bacterium]